MFVPSLILSIVHLLILLYVVSTYSRQCWPYRSRQGRVCSARRLGTSNNSFFFSVVSFLPHVSYTHSRYLLAVILRHATVPGFRNHVRFLLTTRSLAIRLWMALAYHSGIEGTYACTHLAIAVSSTNAHSFGILILRPLGSQCMARGRPSFVSGNLELHSLARTVEHVSPNLRRGPATLPRSLFSCMCWWTAPQCI